MSDHYRVARAREAAARAKWRPAAGDGNPVIGDFVRCCLDRGTRSA